MSEKKLTKSMPEVKLAISARIRGLVDETAATIKDLHQRELFKSSVLGDAHPEPGTHESPQVGVPEHMEPGMHEQMVQSDAPAPVGESAPTSAALGVPGGELDGDIAPENGTLDICPLCQNEDTPETCTCLSAMMKNQQLGYGGMPPMVKAEMCKKCSSMHKPLDKCGDMKPGKVQKAWPKDQKENRANKQGFHIHNQLPKPDLAVHTTAGVSRELKEKGQGLPVKAPKGPHDQLTHAHTPNQGGARDKAAEKAYWKKNEMPSMDPGANGNKPNQGKTVDARAGLAARASANAAAGPRKPPLSKAVDSPATVPDPKAKNLPKDSTKAVTGAGGQKPANPKENPIKKGDVPTAKPPSGKVPGGTAAPPMATNTSKPGLGAAPKAPKAPGLPPPAPGMAKAALPANPKAQMQQHMMADASRKPAAPAGKPAAMPGHLQGFLDEKQSRPATLTHPTNPGRANDLASQVPGGTFQPPPAPKLQGMRSPPPAAAAPKRSLFQTLFGGKK